MSGTRNPDQPWKPFPVFLGEGFKIIAMGVLLAVLIFVFFIHEASTPAPLERPMDPITEHTPVVPTLDKRVLEMVADQTRQERLVLEREPFRHVLEAALDVVPAVARQLGMPEEPLDAEQLRTNPGLYRGRFVWAAGTLLDVSPPIQGHPVEGYAYYEGRLETPEGDTIAFAFSLPPTQDVTIGDWVRMEGYFLKLRDSHFPEVVMAPMLVGRQLQRSYAAWDPVLDLDPRVLASIADGDFRAGLYYEGTDSNLTLAEYQDVPLWHLASYSIAHKDDMGLEGWRRVEPLVREEQLLAIMRGEVRKGTRMRVLGEGLQARVFEADTNPIGVKDWSEVWVQVHDLGGRIVPVWIPERVEFKQRRVPVELRGYLFMRHAYDSLDGDRRVTPVFVAATFDRYESIDHPMVARIGWILAGVVSVLIIVFYFMARRDRVTRAQHESAMVERRRRRRQRLAPATGHE